MRPLVVVESSPRAVAELRREIVAAGWRIVDAWRGEPGVVCAGTVSEEADAAEALLAALGGAGLLIEARAERALVDRLVDDLRRLGRVEHHTREPDLPGLTREERDVLELLAEGVTLGAAAKRLHVSRRTADRRLAGARAKLGVATTAEAVLALARPSPFARGVGDRAAGNDVGMRNLEPPTPTPDPTPLPTEPEPDPPQI